MSTCKIILDIIFCSHILSKSKKQRHKQHLKNLKIDGLKDGQMTVTCTTSNHSQKHTGKLSEPFPKSFEPAAKNLGVTNTLT
jgi:hypothetical protein